MASDPVTFHTPDVAILNYSKESWKEYLSLAEEAVFVQQKKMTGNVETEESKRIDKEAEYSWVQNISRALNNDLMRAIQAVEDMSNSNPVDVSVEQPISFAMVTESEAFDALDTIISSDAPVFVKSQQVENFVSKFVSKSSPVVKALRILKMIDPLYLYSNKDVQTFKSNNVASVDAWTMHVYAYVVLMQLYESDKLLFDKNEDVIIGLVQKEVDKYKVAVDLKSELIKVA